MFDVPVAGGFFRYGWKSGLTKTVYNLCVLACKSKTGIFCNYIGYIAMISYGSMPFTVLPFLGDEHAKIKIFFLILGIPAVGQASEQLIDGASTPAYCKCSTTL